MSDKIMVLAWSELTEPKEVYPNGINGALAEYLSLFGDMEVETGNINEPEQGLSEERLSRTDVLIWFGHVRHNDVTDEAVERVVRHVKERGMGYLALHSSHFAKPLKALLGTSCAWRTYVEDGKPGFIKVVNINHPIAKGIEDFVIPREEWYGEPFDVPTPEAVILAGLYCDGRELARDAMVWTIGNGRVFYFRPGHETYPIFYMEEVRKVIANAVRWLAKRI